MPVTFMWGERGLVATFFMDLSAVPNLQRWIAFLNPPPNEGATVQWGGRRSGFTLGRP
jgi:hypothetical protein